MCLEVHRKHLTATACSNTHLEKKGSERDKFICLQSAEFYTVNL